MSIGCDVSVYKFIFLNLLFYLFLILPYPPVKPNCPQKFSHLSLERKYNFLVLIFHNLFIAKLVALVEI